MDEALRLGIVGVGGMGIANYHARTFLEDERVRLVACCDIVPEALETFAERYQVPGRYLDLESMLKEEALDLVNICTNETLHAPMTILTAGYRPKAILCEKPMAMSLQEADEMVAACRDNGVLLVIGHQRRYRGAYPRAKELLDEGAIGDLEQIQVTGHHGSGLLPDGTHLLDLMRFFVDDNPAEWVMGQVDARTRRQGYGHVMEDAVVALIRFENGVRGWLTTGGRISPRQDPLGTQYPFHYLRMILHGSRGRMEISGDSTRVDPTGTGRGEGAIEQAPLRLVRGDAVEEIELDARGWHGGVSPHSELLQCLEDGHSHPLNGENARAGLEILLAIFESARLGRLIPLPLENRGNPLEQMLGG